MHVPPRWRRSGSLLALWLTLAGLFGLAIVILFHAYGSDANQFSRFVGWANILSLMAAITGGAIGVTRVVSKIHKSKLPASPNPSSGRWLRQLIAAHDRPEWTTRIIQLGSRNALGQERPIDDVLVEWITIDERRPLLLTGDFGSGKTWTLRRLARNLAARRLEGRRDTPLPVVLNLSALERLDSPSFSDLFRIAWPSPMPEKLLTDEPGQVLVMLDGLDELVRINQSDVTRVADTLRVLAQFTATTTRFIFACRSSTLQSSNIVDILVSAFGMRDEQDLTAWAVHRTLGGATSAVEIATLIQVTTDQADLYLSRSAASNDWERIGRNWSFPHLARLPFTIFMLEQALPRIETAGNDLSSLYDAAVRGWLSRFRITDTDLPRFQERLEEIAVARLFRLRLGDSEIDRTLLECGILRLEEDGSLDLCHYSLDEYLIARSIARELVQYRSDLLSRVDLAYAYNINRFLIPMLYAMPGEKSANPVEKDEQISIADFLDFMASTSWRRTGFGTWRSLAEAVDHPVPYDVHSPDAVDIAFDSAIKGRAGASKKNSPAVAISWYDAFQYCRWRGGRFPTTAEAATFLQLHTGTGRLWTGAWHQEPISQMRVARLNPDKDARAPVVFEGINPDLRLNDLGLLVIAPKDHKVDDLSGSGLRRAPHMCMQVDFHDREIERWRWSAS